MLKLENNLFESIKHYDEAGNEYWSARELQKGLEYNTWQKFQVIVNKAMISCENSKFNVSDHFIQVGKMVNIGSKTTRSIRDYKLSRYACYLIAQNGDSRKK